MPRELVAVVVDPFEIIDGGLCPVDGNNEEGLVAEKPQDRSRH